MTPQRRLALLGSSRLGRSCLAEFGGPGSGNFGHGGCPGQQGGSCDTGGDGGKPTSKDPAEVSKTVKAMYDNLPNTSYDEIDAIASHLKTMNTEQVKQVAKDFGKQASSGSKTQTIAWIRDKLAERKGRQDRNKVIEDAANHVGKHEHAS